MAARSCVEVEQVSGIPAGITWISEYLDFLYPYPYLDFQNAGIRYDKVSDQDTCTGIRHMSFSYQDTCTWVDTCPFRYQDNLLQVYLHTCKPDTEYKSRYNTGSKRVLTVPKGSRKVPKGRRRPKGSLKGPRRSRRVCKDTEGSPKVPKGSRRSRRVPKVPKGPQRSERVILVILVLNDPKWSQMAQNDLKWSQMAQNGPKWSQMAPNCSKSQCY